MLSRFGNFSAVYYDDIVGVAHCFQAVCNHYYRLAFCKLFDCVHQIRLVFGVNVCGRLIQNDYRAVFHYRARNGNALFFAAAKARSTFADYSVVAVGKIHYKIVAAGFFCRFDYFFARRIVLPERNIVRNRVFEKIYILEHETEIFHQIIVFVVFDVFSIKINRALVHIPEPAYQMAKRSLSAS